MTSFSAPPYKDGILAAAKDRSCSGKLFSAGSFRRCRDRRSNKPEWRSLGDGHKDGVTVDNATAENDVKDASPDLTRASDLPRHEL